ncbi:CopG family transcriptional regulator [Nesterenkonia sp. MY13]|uniref:CopG family transcriptional regulator n=1 Tax=Nesterenkonia sedimenti TaxID=1463632 RepID=A0A7X8YE62_9MICC|nr:CopG family transcriptional regulator [Nesterenkonia sedimenti]NLS10493.1 CopG family transcriptional regulator [Nesterenkonia sedimenti]
MGLKRTTVMVEESDLETIKAAAKREGRAEAEYIREAIHLAALNAQSWTEQEWDIPVFDFGREVTQAEIDTSIRESISNS